MTTTDYIFDFPRQYLRPALVVSLLSVWVLVGLCFYLNSYTRRRYFTMWSAAWLFYALWLTLSITLPDGLPQTVLVLLKHACVGIAATFMLWGASTFLNQRSSDRLFGLFLAFIIIWSYVVATRTDNAIWLQLPVFTLIGLGSSLTAYGFYRSRRQTNYMGASLLSLGFLLWGAYLACYPLWEWSEEMISSGFFISAVLQLFIAVSMIILVLEEARASNLQALREIEQQRNESAGLRTKVQTTEERYRSLFSQASEAIVITSADDLRLLELNEAGRRLLGLNAADPNQHYLSAYVRLQTAPDGAPTTGPEWYAALCSQQRIEIVRADGTAVPAEVSGAPVEVDGLTTYQFFLREMTEKARLEQQLRQAEKLSALGRMISGVAHELNNPLAVVKGYLDLILSRHDISAQTRTDLGKVVHESNRAAKLVSNFLSLARERPSERTAVQINDVVRRVVELREIDLRVAGVQLELRLDSRVPTTLADPDQLEQVLVNLVTNGVHALMEWPGARRLLISTDLIDGTIRMKVEDTGPGVPSHILPQIFEPFFTTKDVGSGTGLGLSIAQNIVAGHNGRIFYEPAARGGAGFVIELPVIRTESEPPRESAVDHRELEREASAAPGGRILVVDDEKVLAELLAELLSTLGYTPVTCSSALMALELLEEQEFDLILSDFRMPLMNGKEFYDRVNQTRPALARRMIFLTGDVVTQETRAFLESAGNPHLPKPFRLDMVAKTVSRMLQGDAVLA